MLVGFGFLALVRQALNCPGKKGPRALLFARLTYSTILSATGGIGRLVPTYRGWFVVGWFPGVRRCGARKAGRYKLLLV